MKQKYKTPVPTEHEEKLPLQFTSQSGMTVNTSDNIWELSPVGKGRFIDITWLNLFKANSKLRAALLDTLIHYAETKSAATCSTVRFAIFDVFPTDNDNIHEFNRRWSALGTSAKKTIRGFLSTCIKLNHKYLKKHHDIAVQYKHKPKFQALHPTKGRLTDYEYDSILENLRRRCATMPNTPPSNLDFYTRQRKKEMTFINYKGMMAYRMLIQIARRPKQIAMLKWCDVLPIGVSFKNHGNIEPLDTGVKALHLRSFKIKQTKQDYSFRAVPEKWSIPLSESFSDLLLRYKAIYCMGIHLAQKAAGVKEGFQSAQKLIHHCPLFPSLKLFSADFASKDIVNALCEEKSQIYHLSEGSIVALDKTYGKGLSERQHKVTATNNRLRHTWLCNAALSGKTLADICKITNVSLPSARHYLQLGLKERQFIDQNYAANTLLHEAFNPKPFAKDTDTIIGNASGDAVATEKDTLTCNVCEHKKRMTRPIACYGCPNFIPLLEADHFSILEQALAKKKFMEKFGSLSKNEGATKRLDKAIDYIRLTIAICNETRINTSTLTIDQ